MSRLLSLPRITLATLVLMTSLLGSFASHAQEQNLNEMPAGSYQLDLEHASVVWKVSHFGFSTYPGRFTKFDADLQLNPQSWSDSSVSVVIDVNSIQTAYPNPDKTDFDQVLANDWLLAADYPEIRFVSSSVSDLNEGAFTIEGTLSMAGESGPVSLQATFNKATLKHVLQGKPVIGFSATTTLDRTKWGVSKFAPGIGAEVLIEIEGEFIYNADN